MRSEERRVRTAVHSRSRTERRTSVIAGRSWTPPKASIREPDRAAVTERKKTVGTTQVSRESTATRGDPVPFRSAELTGARTSSTTVATEVSSPASASVSTDSGPGEPSPNKDVPDRSESNRNGATSAMAHGAKSSGSSNTASRRPNRLDRSPWTDEVPQAEPFELDSNRFKGAESERRQS